MKPSFPPLLLVALLALCAPAHAEVSVLGTRVVYPAEQREVGVPLKNEGARASLLQAWIADGDLEQKPEVSKAPFILDKPLFRLESGQSHILRVRSLPAQAPKDSREHLYWLNVVDVPPREAATGENAVQVAIRFRMKVLYRPKGLGAPVNPVAQVSIRPVAEGLVLHNAARHYFNVAEMTLVSAHGERSLDQFYLAPGETRTLAFPEGFAGPLSGIRYSWVDDEGALHPESPTMPPL